MTLEIDDVEEAVDESQKVLEVNDTTDLKQAAKFDIFAWMKANNIDGFNSGEDDDVVNSLNKQSLMKEYIIPKPAQMSKDGILKFIFNNKIKVITDYTQLLQNKRNLKETII